MSCLRRYYDTISNFFSDPAEIIQTRYGDNEYEYYVHYEGYNRRLDEWVLHTKPLSQNFKISFQVPRARIMSSRFNLTESGQKMQTDKVWKERPIVSDLLSDSSDRKITRNQKRRHDEINHVQKT